MKTVTVVMFAFLFLLVSCQKELVPMVQATNQIDLHKKNATAAEYAAVVQNTKFYLSPENPIEGSSVFAGTDATLIVFTATVKGTTKTFDGGTVTITKGKEYIKNIHLYNDSLKQLGMTSNDDGTGYYSSTILGEQTTKDGENIFSFTGDIDPNTPDGTEIQIVVNDYFVNGYADPFPVNLVGVTLIVKHGAVAASIIGEGTETVLHRSVGEIARVFNAKITTPAPLKFKALTLRSNNFDITRDVIKNVRLVVNGKEVRDVITTAKWQVTDDIVLGPHSLVTFYVPGGYEIPAGNPMIQAYVELLGGEGMQFKLAAYDGDLVMTDIDGNAITLTGGDYIAGNWVAINKK